MRTLDWIVGATIGVGIESILDARTTSTRDPFVP
jgi:hypothetical protein